MTNKTPRPTQPRRWRSLVAVGTSASLALAGAATAAPLLTPPHGIQSAASRATTAEGAILWKTQASGGEAGESGASVGATPDAGYLTALALVEGHLRAGLALYRDGKAELAVTHMKHPGDELYADLAGELQEYGADGFADELALLADAVESGKPLAEAEAAFAAVTAKIDAARAKAGSEPRAMFDAMVAVLRVAATEHAAGIVDGKVQDLHEYQDAWGFVQAVRSLAAQAAQSDDPLVKATAEKALAALDETADAFDGLTPDHVAGEADILLGAAARIELAAFKVK